MRLLPCAAALLLLCATAAAADPPVQITGSDRLPVDLLRRVAGEPPAGVGPRRVWAADAVERILAAYRERGYLYARAWKRVERDSTVRIAIDEGRMNLAFVNTGAFRSFLYRVDLFLPGKIFHRPTLLMGLSELKTKYGLVNAYYRVTDEYPLVANPFGRPVQQRLLRVYAIPRERFGWGFEVSLSSTWGIVPTGKFSHRDLLLDDDRFHSELSIAVPYRRLLFEDGASFQWVHGELELGYRLPRFAGEHIAPLVDGATSLSRYSRTDQQIESYLRFHGDIFANLMLLISRSFSVTLGGGLVYTNVFDLTVPAEVTPTEEQSDSSLLRYTGRLKTELRLDRRLLRRDERNEIHTRADLGFSRDGEAMLDGRYHAQLVWYLGRLALITRSRGVLMVGDVRFWDEEPLAGAYLRTFFANRFWVREALQLTLATRFAVTQTFKIGLFHDLALFADRSRDEQPIAVANAFGPGLHFLLFDLFALDVNYAFGFAPVIGFEHNFFFKLQNAF